MPFNPPAVVEEERLHGEISESLRLLRRSLSSTEKNQILFKVTILRIHMALEPLVWTGANWKVDGIHVSTIASS